MSAEKRRKVNHQAVSLRFVGYLVGFKGKKFWEPEGNMFVELAHAKWSTLHTSEQPLRSEIYHNTKIDQQASEYS